MFTNYTPEAKRLLIANVIAFVGFGLTLQYPLIYLNSVRGIGLNEAGALLTFAGLLGLAVSPVAGSLIDRYGANTIMTVSGLLMAVSAVAFAHVTSFALAALIWTLATMAQAARFPAFSTLLGVRVSEAERGSAYALNYAGVNLGIGFGGLLGGFLIDINQLGTFQTAFYIQAAFAVLFVLLTWRIKDERQAVLAKEASAAAAALPPSSASNVWLGMLHNRTFILLCLLNLLFWGNVSQQNSFLPLYATQDIGATPRELGYALGLNTLVIAVLQMPVMGWLRHISRRLALGIMFVGIVLGWILMLVAGNLPQGGLPLLLVVLTPGVIGLAETVFSPIVPAWILKVSPPEQIGRYNGVSMMVAGIAQNIAPLIATLFVQANANVSLLWLLIFTCGLGVAVSWWLRE
ncbi:MAG: MFS transporter [Anaerolineae bacterium]|nr:MFS transporter [Anaerolineae bacterium]